MKYQLLTALTFFSMSVFGQLSITNCTVVNAVQGMAGRPQFTFQCDLVNPGGLLASATATLTGLDPFAIRALPGMDTLTFATVPGGSTATSTNTVAIQVSENWPDLAKLQWTIQGTPRAVYANAGTSQTVNIGSRVTLDGSKSGGTGTLAYNWRFTSIPAGSSHRPLMMWADTPFPSFVADTAGDYVVTLTVSNGGVSDTAEVKVTAGATQPGKTALLIPVGVTEGISVVLPHPATSDTVVQLTSSDPSIVTVSSASFVFSGGTGGVAWVTGIKEGLVTITATLPDGTCWIVGYVLANR